MFSPRLSRKRTYTPIMQETSSCPLEKALHCLKTASPIFLLRSHVFPQKSLWLKIRGSTCGKRVPHPFEKPCIPSKQPYSGPTPLLSTCLSSIFLRSFLQKSSKENKKECYILFNMPSTLSLYLSHKCTHALASTNEVEGKKTKKKQVLHFPKHVLHSLSVS